MKKQKKILLLDFVFVIGTLLVGGIFSYLFFANEPQFSPDSVTLFELPEGVSELVVDDDIDFSSPEIVNLKPNLIIEVDEGIYYWKIRSFNGEEIRQLQINDKTSLVFLVSENGNYVVANADESLLNVDYYSYGEFAQTKIIGGGG